MPLPAGTRIGPYEILAPLGAGGMGEVFRAHDTKLGRSVALKILPAALAADADRLARFEREARTLAALNHPNIAQVYDFEEGPPAADGQPPARALIMELVPGESLAARLARGRLAVPDAIAIARQMADGLAAAHDRGVIHRDLKPANIQITPEGTVKLLDFGLAKTVPTGAAAAIEGTGDVTGPASLTEAGVVFGTAAYMSPEQARGLAVDARTDVWAYGCVLYEMLTGRRAFDETNVPDLLAAVLRAEVDWQALPEDVPPMTRAYLQRCLQRDLRQRLHGLADMRLALDGAFDSAVRPADRAGPGARRAWSPALTIALAIAVALAAGAGGWRFGRAAAPRPDVTRMRLELPSGNDFYYNGRHLVAVSPAGSHVVYGAGLGLWMQALDQLDPVPVPGAELEGRSPFFSPDGQWIAYYSGGELRRAPVRGGAMVTIAKAVNPWGASWAPDGTVYYGQGPAGIWRVRAMGGTPERAIEVGEGEIAHGPQLMPGGEWVLFTLLPKGVGSWDRANIVMASLATKERTTIVEGGRDARYLASGHLLYAVHGAILAAPFDPSARRLTGAATSVVENVFDAGTITGAVHFDVSSSGTLAFVPRIGTALRLVWVDRQGREEPIPGELRPYRHPRVSPDGSRIVVEVEEPSNLDVWVGDARRGAFSRLTNNPDVDSDPIWSPDGSRIVFTSVRGATGIFAQAADGSGGATRVVEGTGGVRPLTWTTKGELGYEELAGSEVRVLPLAGAPRPTLVPLFDRPEYFNERLPAISPDGKWVAYNSTESGEMEIFVRPFPDTAAGRWQISIGGGFAPLWSHDGRELYYRNQRSIMAAAVKTTPTFSHAAPQALIRLTDYVLAGTRGVKYDVAPDGRFLLLKDDQGRETRNRIVVVQHWFEELRRLVPSR
jgi:serine/threonine-protein kinase